MAKTIVQKAFFRASPKELYGIYMSSRRHGAAIGAPASVEARVGGRFGAFGVLSGKFLMLAKDKVIVQTWCSKTWKNIDPDSILILAFNSYRDGTRIELTHVQVPDYDYEGVKAGGPRYYWRLWRKYLSLRQ